MNSNNMNELWEPIKGYESKYEISNLGNVKSKPSHGRGWGRLHNKTILRKLITDKNRGNKLVVLCKNSSMRTFSVHRLVAEHFISEPNPKKDVVVHKDGDLGNNDVRNLVWKTFGEAMTKEVGPIFQYNWDLTFEKEWEKLEDVTLANSKIERKGVLACLRGSLKTYGGKVWSKEKLNEVEIVNLKKSLRLVYQYNKEGELVKIWRNANKASLSSNKFFKQQIVRCCKDMTKYHAGFYWRFYDDKVNYSSLSDVEVYQYNWDMMLIKKHPSINKLVKNRKYVKGGIMGNVQGKTKTYLKYVWSLKPLTEDEKAEKLQALNVVYQLDMHGNILNLWRNITTIKKIHTKLNPTLIKSCCESQLNDYKGYKWRFHENLDK